MSILGIDYGLKRIGIACTDELNISSYPLLQIENKDDNSHFDEILEVISQRPIDLILIGIPFKDDGRLKIQDHIEKFSEDLSKLIDIKILHWDENFTTDEAEDFLIKNKVSRKKRKNLKDKLAACNIINSYLRSLS